MNSGASVAWMSDDPAVVRARQAMVEGRFGEAERILGLGEGAAREEMREIVRRMRWEYGLDEAGLLERLRKSIPDVTAQELERWRVAGQVQHRMIDGKVGYFRAEPSNIFRFCDEAKRRKVVEEAKPGFVLTDHLSEVIAAAKKAEKAHVMPVWHRAAYSLTITPKDAEGKRGSIVRCWLPFAQEYRHQRDVKLLSASPGEPVIAPTAVDEWPMRGAAQRTAYFEQRVEDPSRPMTFAVSMEFTSWAYYPQIRDEEAQTPSKPWLTAYLGERPPHIAFSPRLHAAVAEAAGDVKNPLARARRIFEWIDANIRYNAEEEYCLIPSFVEKALNTRRGDCGIQAMLFITMCRCAGVPARWQSGWQSKPSGLNMHDWAEFYVEPWGWLPADPSYGLHKHDDPAVRYFHFGHRDPYRLIVNLDYGSPLHPAKATLRSEPADFQRGEVEMDGKNVYFDKWEHGMKFEYETQV